MLSSSNFSVYILHISNNISIPRFNILVLILISFLVSNIFKTCFCIYAFCNSFKKFCFISLQDY